MKTKTKILTGLFGICGVMLVSRALGFSHFPEFMDWVPAVVFLQTIYVWSIAKISIRDFIESMEDELPKDE